VVRAGDCYTLKATGECRDNRGRVFSPDGPLPAEARTLLGEPARPAGQPGVSGRGEYFPNGLPPQMLVAKAGNAAVQMAMGSGLTFIAPEDGELTFRLNDPALGDVGSTGRVEIELVAVSTPAFVGPDGKTTIRTLVAGTKYLVFEPDGLRWEYASALRQDAGLYPTLINGIAWWPERDPRDFTMSRPLKTQAFSWAARPEAIEPNVIFEPAETAPGAAVSPGVSRGGLPAVRFTVPGRGAGEVSCGISRP